MVADQEVAFMLNGKGDRFEGRVQAEGYGVNCSVRIAYLDSAVVPGFGSGEGEKLIGDFEDS